MAYRKCAAKAGGAYGMPILRMCEGGARPSMVEGQGLTDISSAERLQTSSLTL